MTHADHIREVRELLERHWTAAEIAHKCCITEDLAALLIKQLTH